MSTTNKRKYSHPNDLAISFALSIIKLPIPLLLYLIFTPNLSKYMDLPAS